MAHKIMRKDLFGNKYGKLLVDRIDEEKTKDGKVYWICKCECGNTKSIQSTSLTRTKGGIKSCGCGINSKEAKEKSKITSNSYPKDIANLVFGRLTVLERTNMKSDKKSDHGSYLWKCLCECGNIVYYSRYQLISCIGVKSCGCYHIDKLLEHTENIYDLSGSYGIGYCDNGTEFYFDLEDYEKIKNNKWYYDGRYVQCHNKEDNGKNIRLHRLLLGLTEDDKINVDHINHFTYDNRKNNLRLANHSQNSQNKKCCYCTVENNVGLKKTKNNKYIVTIQGDYIGTYESFEEAYNIRKAEEENRYKEFLYNPNGDYYEQKKRPTS